MAVLNKTFAGGEGRLRRRRRITTSPPSSERGVGRGVARALKATQVAWAKENGYEELRTRNEERDAPIRHLNEQFGYRLDPPRYLKGPLAQAARASPIPACCDLAAGRRATRQSRAPGASPGPRLVSG